MTDNKQAAIEAITTEKSRLYDFANNPNLTQFELKHEVIKYCAGLTGYISQLRAALQSKTVDVDIESLKKQKKTFPKNRSPYDVRSSHDKVEGWNECLGYLAENGYLNTPQTEDTE